MNDKQLALIKSHLFEIEKFFRFVCDDDRDFEEKRSTISEFADSYIPILEQLVDSIDADLVD